MHEQRGLEPHLAAALEAEETIHVRTKATNADLALSTRRVFVVNDKRILLSVPIDSIRRVQFDIERDRPATLVIVPESAQDEPQVLAIPPESYETAGKALALIGLKLAEG